MIHPEASFKVLHGRISTVSSALFVLFALSACEVPGTSVPVEIPGRDPASDPAPKTSPTPTATPSASVTPTATPVPTSTPVASVSKLAIELGIPESLDLRRFDGPVESQFGGTCSAFATAAAMDNVLRQKGVNKQVSERHLWSTYGVYDAWYAVEAAKKYPLTEDQYWPVNGTRASNYMDYASLKITQAREFEYEWKPALQAMGRDSRPLVMAIQVPSDLANCRTDVRATSGKTSGQHVVEAVGYQLDDSVAGGGYFILKNSWGADCGEKGYHYYPFQLCERSDLYCYFIEVVDVEAK